MSIGLGVYSTKWSDSSVLTRSLNGLVRARKQGDWSTLATGKIAEQTVASLSCLEWPDERIGEKVGGAGGDQGCV